MTSTSSINDVAKVAMLDGSVHNYNVKTKSYANTLLQAIMKDLNILEADYFGVQFKDKEGNEVFLDPLKKIRTQMKNIGKTSLKFVVKFFPPDPGELQEEYTRYLVALQIRQDIAAGMLYCHENTLIAMASCIVQADCGDWNPIEHSDSSYVKNLNILPAASNEEDIYEKICDKHKTRIGESPGEADRQLLDIVRRLEHYGLRLHPAKDQENTEIELAAAHLGILIFHGTSKINTFNWSRIRKLSFKKKRFLIKLKHEQNTGSTGDILVFVMASRDTCKNFWRHCVEYHAFFRLEIKTAAPQKTVIRRGSTFRYSGKTQKQLHDLVKNSNFRRTTFVRATSRKYHYAKRRLSGELTSTNNFQTSVVAENGSQVVHNIPVQAEDDAIQYSTPASSPLAANLSPDELTVDEKAASDWQVESKNLHSSSVAAKHDRDGDDAESSTANTVQGLPCKLMSEVDDESSPVPSPVHLHSGGISETKQILESTSSVNLPSPPAALLSTQGLKSTSSPTDSRYPSSPAYYIAKELLTTERTYVRDLEVICVGFKMEMQRVKEGKDRAGGMLSADVSEQLFGGGDALLTLHRRFLTDIDQHLLTWEGRTSLSDHTSREQLVNQLIMNHMIVLKKHLNSIENAAMVISSLEDVARNSSRFESIYREFELQKMCYLPFSSFLLKPIQRILHYNIVLERLVKHYDEQAALAHHDSLSRAARASHDLADALCETLKKAHNLQKMTQLRRDLIGVDNLLSPERSFIREGSLYKLSRKGFQQRLFFLFDDCLLYTSKGVTSTNQFKVHAELPLNGMIIEINDGDNSVPNCFSILSASKTVIVAAASQQEMDKWLEDFSIAISRATRRDHVSNYDSPLTDGAKGSESRLSFQSSEDGDQRNSLETSRIKIPTQQRSNATMHVCWHRNTSVSSADHLVSLKNQLSGYLLRKFKNSNGWQKLWVVFTNFCLFFYKSHQDDFPLASLPLLGYSVSPPADEDNIRKDFVFKLQFKTHVYFFRAESKFTFERWMEVVSSTTATAQRTRLFSRINSNF